jgi:Protein of unknown function (DUF3616)
MKNAFKEQVFSGIANPSGAVALNADEFIVADDEDNQLRIYNRNQPDEPAQAIALSKVFKGIIEDGEDLEIDIESGALIGNTYFWLGSHSTSRKGKNRPARQRLLAVSLDDKKQVSAVGKIYTDLLDDLENDERFEAFQLDKAREISPKAIGGLSIEGLAATPERTLLIGFRNPLAGGTVKGEVLVNAKALLVELHNPFEVIQGGTAEFGDPLELDLGGFGIREITHWQGDDYLIIAGPYHGNEASEERDAELFRMYRWTKSTGKLSEIQDSALADFNVEAAIFYPDNTSEVQLLSDDGKLAGAGNTFRSRIITLNLC